MHAPLLRALLRVAVGVVLTGPSLFAEGARIVDAPGLPPFSDLQAAVAAATDGDTIVVAGGTYGGFTIEDKTLQVVGVPGQVVTVEGTVEVVGLAARRSVLLSGLTVTGRTTPSTSEAGLVVTACAGHVRVEGCAISGGAGDDPGEFEFGTGGHGVVLQASSRVAFSHCTISGGDGGGDNTGFCYDCTGGGGGLGVRLNQSTPAFYQCTVRGGRGGSNGFQGGAGGHGGRLLNAWLFAAGSSFTGGRGGDGLDFVAAYAGDGGDGLFVDAAGQAQLHDCTFAGGAGGKCVVFPANNGQPGQPQGGPGGFTQHPGRARELQTFRLAFDGSSLQVAVQAEPGDEVWLRVGRRPDFRPQLTLPGVHLAYPTPVPLVALGIVPASGQLLLSIPTAALSAEADRLLYLQGFGRDSAGAGWLGSPMHALVLDREAAPDCNGNLQSDLADVLLGASADCGPNLVPDECDPDCDGNGVPDDCDLAAGTSADCNGNAVPDPCDIALGTSPDCNGNGVPDECDLAAGTSPDANGNGVPDECDSNSTWWVDAAALPGGNGSAGAPFQALAEAMAMAISGDEIVVRDGVYSGPANREVAFAGREVVVRSANGPASTTLDLQGAGRAFVVDGGVGPAARIEGFTFVDGAANGGGAISVSLSDPVISNCVFISCTTSGQGGAILLGASGALIEDCTFVDNSTAGTHPWVHLGGAIYVGGNVGSPPLTRIRRCSFESNSAVSGGAIHTAGEFPLVISHCEFLGNVAADWGGALANRSSGTLGGVVTVDDCLFAGNFAGEDGGAIYARPFVLNYPTEMLVSGSTFTANRAADEGGALAIELGSSSSLVNSILWGNAAPLGAQLALDYEGNPTWGIPVVRVERCDVQGGQAAVSQLGGSLTWAAGNLDVDPQLADPDGPDNDPLTLGDNDYRPIAGSPVHDAGDNALVPPDRNDVDGDGNTQEPTPLDLDLGARRVDDLLAPDVGAGTPPLVDLGCYEQR